MTIDEVKIENRCLTLAEAKIIQLEIRETPNITGYSLKELVGLKNVFTANINGKFAGLIANIGFSGNWLEISAFVVLKAYRGKGIGRKLFEKAFAAADKSGRNYFIVSRNPVVIKMIESRSGLKRTNRFSKLPVIIIIREILSGFSWYRIGEYLRKLSFRKSSGWLFGYHIVKSK